MRIDINQPDRLELVEVFERGRSGSSTWRTFEVGISPPDSGGYRTVWIDDPSRSIIPVARYESTQTGRILGNWKTVGDSEEDYIMRFDVTGKVTIITPTSEIDGGEFEWVGDDSLRLVFNWYYQPAAIEDSACQKSVPSFFAQFCQHNLSEPSPVPYPPEYYYPSPYSPPVLRPTPAPGAIDTIDETFEVTIEGEMLSLIHESGTRLTLERLIGE